MKYITVVLFCLSLLFSNCVHAQLEKLIVETYYVSDESDSTDVNGGKLDSGSVTYRVYVDMLPGSTLKQIYGDTNHILKIASTAPFFNNVDRGQVFGYDIVSKRLSENTVALDTWLTLGQAAKSASEKYIGVLKNQDTDSSIVGGVNNDGHSNRIINKYKCSSRYTTDNGRRLRYFI
jgi:hypothetical protein